MKSYIPFASFHLGRILFRPSGVISYMYESNLLASSTESTSDHSIRIEPSIEAFLPLSANGIRVDYSALWRKYKNYDLRQNFDHTLNADSQFDLSPILNLALRDHFVLSALDSREYVPGREVIFSDSRFRRNELEGQLNWTPSSSDSAAIRVGWNRVTFDQDVAAGSIPFYDYSECRYSALYRRSVSQRTTAFVDASFRQVPTHDPREIADSRGYEAVAGVETILTPLTSAELSMGVRTDHYPGAASEDHRTLVLRGNFVKEITERDRISFAFSRGTGMSYFQRNAFFLTQGYGITYTHEIGRGFYFSLNPGYLRNSYTLPIESGPGIPAEATGNKRIDGLVEITFDARYTYSEWVAIELWFDMLRRRSILQEYSFTDYRFGLSLLLGSRNNALGRSQY